jgi:uncharacterized OB-fold protein
LPVPTTFSKPFWDGCEAGKLMYQRCDVCDKALFDPTPMCTACASFRLSWHESAGGGSLYSWSVVWRPSGPEFTCPYAAIIVDVDEGFQILANAVGCEPEDLYLGQRLAVEFHPIGGGLWMPYFRPISPG